MDFKVISKLESYFSLAVICVFPDMIHGVCACAPGYVVDGPDCVDPQPTLGKLKGDAKKSRRQSKNEQRLQFSNVLLTRTI